jgi:hypothetical protein
MVFNYPVLKFGTCPAVNADFSYPRQLPELFIKLELKKGSNNEIEYSLVVLRLFALKRAVNIIFQSPAAFPLIKNISIFTVQGTCCCCKN